MTFKEEYFQIWKAVWDLHKKYYGIKADDTEKWELLTKESEQIANQYEQSPEQEFTESLVLLVIRELDTKSEPQKGGKEDAEKKQESKTTGNA